jgi:hypothetical protein
MGLLIVLIPVLGIAAAIRSARGTTLVAPLAWALLAYVFTGGVATFLPVSHADWSKWIFIASTSTLCPAVALFGAKRPQNRAWQWIVVAFWFVLSLPALQSLLLHRGESLEIHTIWKWFIAVLIVAGCVNHLPTRYGWAAMAIAAGQIQLFWKHLPWTPSPVMVGHSAGLALLLLGFILAYLAQRIRQRELSEFQGWNRTWLDFRDAFGVVWALRVIERVNTMPAAMEAAMRLNWGGFFELIPGAGHASCTTTGVEEAVPANQVNSFDEEIERRPATIFAMAPLDASLRNLMRRFVSKQWLDARLKATRKDAE